MAVKNANDGIAMTKSVEGAIGEVSDMLQRMRELAIQAANGTNSSADRTFLQNEVNLLIQEITRVSTNTRYNGELILDGTFLNKQLQVGIEEGEVITMSVESIAADGSRGARVPRWHPWCAAGGRPRTRIWRAL